MAGIAQHIFTGVAKLSYTGKCSLVSNEVDGPIVCALILPCCIYQALVKFLMSVDWADLQKVQEAHRLIHKWAKISPEVS